MYIPGFTNMLTQRMARGGRTSRFADADGFMYDPEMGFMSEDMGGPAYVDFTQYVDPQAEAQARAQAEAQAPFVPSVQPSAPPIMSAPSEQPFTAPQFSDLFPNGIDQETLAAMLSTSPGAVVSPAASQPGPGAGLVTTPGGEQGFYFYTDKGRLAGYDGKGGFLTADPNAQYRMWDERGKNRIVSEGTGVEALQNIYNTANQFNQEQGKKANWGIERLNPTTGRWERVAENDPAKGLGIVGDIIGGALPLAALAIPGFGQMGLLAQAAIGAGLGGAGAGIAGNDVLKGAVMGGLTAAGGHLGGELLGPGKLGLNVVGTKAGTAIGSGLGATAGGLATGQPLDNALIGGALAGAGTFAGQQAAGALRDMGVNLPAFNAPTPSTPGNIVVTGPANVPIPVSTGMGGGSGKPKPPTPEPMSGGIDDTGILVRAGGALPMLGAGLPIALPQGTPTTPEELAQRRAEQERENEIIVEAQRGSLPAGFDPGPLSTALPNLISTPVSTPDLSPEIVVEGERAPFDDTAAGLPFVPPTTPLQTPDLGGEIIVTDTKLADDTTGALPFVPPTTPLQTPDLGGEIIVTDTKLADDTTGALPFVPPTTPLQTPDVAGDPITVETERKPAQVTTAALPFYAGLPIPIPAGTPTTAEELAKKQAEDREKEIVVPGDRTTPPSTFDAAFSGFADAATPKDVAGERIVVTETKRADDTTGVAPGVPATTTAPPPPPPVNEIVVGAERKAPADDTTGVAPGVPSTTTPTTPKDVADSFDKEFGEKDLADRLKNLGISDYLRLAALLAPLLGGGGGRPAPGRIPAGLSSGFAPIFSGGLPRPTLPGATGNFAARNPATLRPQTTQDWYRYGYGPSQSFFDYVPQGAPNTSRAFTGYEQAQAQEDKGFYLGGMAGGGDMSGMSNNGFAVNGPGTGRSDQIPAMLSDGEYVIDAETVALLGDGSSKAGANRLDQFRINVRKDKGRNLAKGAFSVNAKRPEHYLKGGRA
jgi:hypothetical protein